MSSTEIQCLRSNNIVSTLCTIDGMDEQPCAVPLIFHINDWQQGAHHVRITFTDECGQNSTKQFSFFLTSSNPGMQCIAIDPSNARLCYSNEGACIMYSLHSSQALRKQNEGIVWLDFCFSFKVVLINKNPIIPCSNLKKSTVLYGIIMS